MKTPSIALRNVVVLLWVALSIGLSSCSSSGDDVTPTNSGEYVSFKINGKEYSGQASSLGDEDYFYLWGVVEKTPADGYSVQLELDKPKLGTFSVPKDRLIATVATLKGSIINPDIQEYALSTNGKGSITIIKFDTNGYSEGTFAFIGQAKDGQKMEVTDGKFRLDMR